MRRNIRRVMVVGWLSEFCPCCVLGQVGASPCVFTKGYIPALILVEMTRIPQSHHLSGVYVPEGGYYSLGHRWEGCFPDSLGCRCW